MYVLKLYIATLSPRYRKLVQKLRNRLDENCGGSYTLEVIDIFDQPDAAYDDEIIVTPTLVKILPPPVRKFVGNLTDENELLVALGV